MLCQKFRLPTPTCCPVSTHRKQTAAFNIMLIPAKNQRSFRKTGTMWTLASQAEIGVWVQAPRTLLQSPAVSPVEKFWDYM